MYRRRGDWTWCSQCEEQAHLDWMMPNPECEGESICENCYIFIKQTTCTLCEDKIYPQEEVVNDDTFRPSMPEIKRVAHKTCWEDEHEILFERP